MAHGGTPSPDGRLLCAVTFGTFEVGDAEEEWRPVAGYEGAYEVSNLGRVRSLDRVVMGQRGPRRLTGKMLRPGAHNEYVTLNRNGRGRTYPIHRLVEAAFGAPRAHSSS
jgi:hypothetical protein